MATRNKPIKLEPVTPTGNDTGHNGDTTYRTPDGFTINIIGNDDTGNETEQIPQEDTQYLVDEPETVPVISLVEDEKPKQKPEKTRNKKTEKPVSAKNEIDENIAQIAVSWLDDFIVNRYGKENSFTDNEKTNTIKHLDKILERLGINDKVIDHPLYDVIALLIIGASVGMRIKTAQAMKEDFSQELAEKEKPVSVKPSKNGATPHTGRIEDVISNVH